MHCNALLKPLSCPTYMHWAETDQGVKSCLKWARNKFPKQEKDIQWSDDSFLLTAWTAQLTIKNIWQNLLENIFVFSNT